MKSNLSLHGDDNHDSYHHGDDIRHGETDEDSLLNDPAEIHVVLEITYRCCNAS